AAGAAIWRAASRRCGRLAASYRRARRSCAATPGPSAGKSLWPSTRRRPRGDYLRTRRAAARRAHSRSKPAWPSAARPAPLRLRRAAAAGRASLAATDLCLRRHSSLNGFVSGRNWLRFVGLEKINYLISLDKFGFVRDVVTSRSHPLKGELSSGNNT